MKFYSIFFKPTAVKIYLIPFFLFVLSGVISCKDDSPKQDEIPDIPEAVEIQDFIWQGLNAYYLWQKNVFNLRDDRFDTDQEYVDFIKNAPEPEDFFYTLLYQYDVVDKWSWIVDDYVALEDLFQGKTKSNGVEFGLVAISNSNDIFGYVRYILPNSDAEGKNIKRGDLFTHVNGVQLNRNNYRDLLFFGDDTYTLSLARIENNTIVPTGIDVTLTKHEYTENPVFIKKVIDEGGKKIGYLMYNSFTSNFNAALNDAFGYFKSEGVSDLILDLRYNPGGSIQTSVYLGSMIAGQLKGKVFSKERWNDKIQKVLEEQHPDWLVNKFTDKMNDGTPLNTLNLTSIHILTSWSTASASELIINGLNPFIDVTIIGEQTVGKYVGSVTLYDSPDFSRNNVNPRHNYAMQPIVLENVNANGENDKDGFEPDILLEEDFENMGVLGDKNEPLLQAALQDILGSTNKITGKKRNFDYMMISDSKLERMTGNNMYTEKPLPKGLFTRTPLNLN